MKVANICPSGGECRKLNQFKLAASLVKVYLFKVFNIFIEKSEMTADNFVKKVELRIWKLRFDS
eukprot:snap_masked-scaffold_18-processed-gene-0.39-mRNA-1 protein AED:1.00 eAED:1.00 QI:0/0/0/0/1/1/2/0/63